MSTHGRQVPDECHMIEEQRSDQWMSGADLAQERNLLLQFQ